MNTTTKEELAKMLEGSQIDKIVESYELELARNSGLVIVYGHSDDGVTLEGMINDETGTTVYITKDGKLFNGGSCRVECDLYKEARIECQVIEATFNSDAGKGFNWTFKTKIPHSTFDIWEDDNQFCMGIVFSIHDLYEIKKPRIICICGSSRFCAGIAVAKWTFEKAGNIAMGLHLLPDSYTDQLDHQAEFEGVAKVLDELHLRKIDLAGDVFIYNKDGYIGERTAIEIEYARNKGKQITYLELPESFK